MTTASLDNCRRLYELSGWGNSEYTWVCVTDMLPQLLTKGATQYIGNDLERVDVPAYDLGYVLRKLQYMEDLAIHRCHHMDNSWNWEAQCHPDPDASDGYSFAYADTPEDAACKLAIALFEAGVLVKEER
jgi:hypothetical protein